jgi:transposase
MYTQLLSQFDKHGIEGLKVQPRSGRPPLIQKKMLNIIQEKSENPLVGIQSK